MGLAITPNQSVYIFDFPDAVSPRGLGFVKIDSSPLYLYPIDGNNNLFLGLGNNTDATGNSTGGLEVYLYNFTNRLQPYLITSYTDSTENIVWNDLAINYQNLGQDMGHLIIPVISMSLNGTSSGGFSIFAVNSTSIEKVLGTASQEAANSCHSCANIADGSFVVGGNIITLTGGSARSYHLGSGKVF